MHDASNPEPVGRVLDAWERERSRVAANLYADVAQRLSASLLYLEVARKELAPTEAAAATQAAAPASGPQGSVPGEALATVRAETEQALEQVRRIARELCPQELEDLGPVAALEAYARELANTHGVVITVEGERLDPLIGREAGAALYRVLQEALANAVRHAEARRLVIHVRETDDGRVEAALEDDGSGFDVREALGDHHRGAGFIQMTEQALRASGTVEVDSRPGGGTRVRVRVPFGG